jgi:hypothetical protein
MGRRVVQPSGVRLLHGGGWGGVSLPAWAYASAVAIVVKSRAADRGGWGGDELRQHFGSDHDRADQRLQMILAISLPEPVVVAQHIARCSQLPPHPISFPGKFAGVDGDDLSDESISVRDRLPCADPLDSLPIVREECVHGFRVEQLPNYPPVRLPLSALYGRAKCDEGVDVRIERAFSRLDLSVGDDLRMASEPPLRVIVLVVVGHRCFQEGPFETLVLREPRGAVCGFTNLLNVLGRLRRGDEGGRDGVREVLVSGRIPEVELPSALPLHCG